MVPLLSARAVKYYVSLDEAGLEDAINEGEAMLKPEALAADNLPEDELRNGRLDVLANRYCMNHNVEGSVERDQSL
jgi:hypothetical protein